MGDVVDGVQFVYTMNENDNLLDTEVKSVKVGLLLTCIYMAALYLRYYLGLVFIVKSLCRVHYVCVVTGLWEWTESY